MSFEEESGGVRPEPLAEPRPQEQVLGHTVDQIVGAVPALPTFDVPVPQTVDQLVEVPTLVSLVEVFEQPVDIPVRAWGGTGGRLQGFLPGQSSSSVE